MNDIITEINCKKNYFSYPGSYNNPFYSIEKAIRYFICLEFKVTEEELICKDRHLDYVLPRHLYRYLLFSLNGKNINNKKYSLDQICVITNSINHCSILHSIKTTKDLINTDKNYRAKYENVIAKLDKKLFML